MKINSLKSGLASILTAGAIALSGCSKQPVISSASNQPQNLTINGSSYVINNDSILQTQSSFTNNDNTIKIGLVSDIEGSFDNAKASANKLKAENVDAVIIAGDCLENEQIRRNPVYPNSTDNVNEMFLGIKPYAELGVPVFVIAGNHEPRNDYQEAMNKLRSAYPNVLDINGRKVDLQGVNIVGLGGYHDARFTDPNGFLINEADYNKAAKDLTSFQSQKEPSILVTHSPPRSNGSIDYVQGAGNVGDQRINGMINGLENIINVCGHIHEGGGNYIQLTNGLVVNVAGVTDFNTAHSAAASELIINNEGEVSYKDLK